MSDATQTPRKARGSRHGLFVAYLALLAALAGTAWAAATIGSDDVINGSLKSADLKNNRGAKGVDVRNRSLRGGDVRAASLAGSDFGANSVGGADVNDSTLQVSRVTDRLGGALGQPLTSSVSYKLLPNNSFTQGAEESQQLIAGGQMTFAPSCVQPRSFTAYLMLDEPIPTASSIIGLVQLSDSGTGAVTKRFNFASAPFPGSPGMNLFRTGAPANHEIFIWAGVNCNSGSGGTLDSARIDVIGHG